MYEYDDMVANSDRGYEMQLDKVLHSRNDEQLDQHTSGNRKNVSSTVEVIDANKTATVKYWKNIKTQ